MKYQVVTIDEAVEFSSEEELKMYCTKNNMEQSGVQPAGSHNEELNGKPLFKGLIGPMGNGKDYIRYETQEAYNLYSS